VKNKTASLSEAPRIIALLIFWFFALFGEGLAGFGIPVVLTAPFLVAIGFRPVDSVAVTLMGIRLGLFWCCRNPDSSASRFNGL
jgi:lactate permease